MNCAVGYYFVDWLDVAVAAVAQECVGSPFDLHSPRRPGSGYGTALGGHLTKMEIHYDGRGV